MRDPAVLARQVLPGRGPVSIEPLSTGLVHRTYAVERDGRRYALRVAPGRRDTRGFAPDWECRVLAAARGLAPPVLHCDPGIGLLVTAWVDGRCWTAVQARAAANVGRVAELLRMIHAVPPPVPARAVSIAEWIDHYAGDGRRDPLAGRAARTLAALARLPGPPPVLCHSDLHRLNLIDTGSALIALDWEYAHVADGFWDLAGWISGNDLGAAGGADLLQQYLGRTASTAEIARLTLVGWLYDYVAYLWCGVYTAHDRDREPDPGGRGVGSVPVAARAIVLAARLRGAPH